MLFNPDLPNATEAYESVKDVIVKAAQSFKRRHGGDLDELVQEASLYFIYAFRSFKAEKGAFPMWVRGVCWRGLQNTAKDIAVDRLYLSRREMPDDVGGKEENHYVQDLIKDLSPDAAEMVEMIIRHSDHKITKTKVKQKRTHLISLLFDLGWPAARILESFKEIRKALTSY